MFRKFLISVMAMSVLFVCSLTVSAAPQKMSDGGIFDAEYYAAQNQDVVNAFGTSDASVLYNHYKCFGEAEGRKPYADSSADNSNAGTDAKPKQYYDGYELYTWHDMGDWGFIIWDNSCGVKYDYMLLSGEPYKIFTERFPGQQVYCNAGFHIKNTNYACYLIYCDPELPAQRAFFEKYRCSCPSYKSHRYVFSLEFWHERPQ